MTPDWLLRLAGIVEFDLQEHGPGALEATAAAFFDAGGVVSPTDWALASEASRIALREAFQKRAQRHVEDVVAAIERRLGELGDPLEIRGAIEHMLSHAPSSDKPPP